MCKNRLFFDGKASRSVLAPCMSMRCVTRGFVTYILFLLFIVYVNVCIGIFELFHLQFAASGHGPVFAEWRGRSVRDDIRYDT